MIGVQGSANGETFIPSSRLDVCAGERRSIEKLPVRHAIECATPGQGEMVELNFLVQEIQKMKKNFFEAMLRSCGARLLPGAQRNSC